MSLKYLLDTNILSEAKRPQPNDTKSGFITPLSLISPRRRTLLV
jgi:hypothetical protein